MAATTHSANGGDEHGVNDGNEHGGDDPTHTQNIATYTGGQSFFFLYFFVDDFLGFLGFRECMVGFFVFLSRSTSI